jgi:hypothetical protein
MGRTFARVCVTSLTLWARSKIAHEHAWSRFVRLPGVGLEVLEPASAILIGGPPWSDVRPDRASGDPAQRITAAPPATGCRHHHHCDACIIDGPALRRWNRHMSAVRLTLHTGLRVRGPGGGV